MLLFKYTKRYTKQFLHNAWSKKSLQFLIFFVTSRCSCSCQTCFYWRSLNQSTDLSLEEIKKISSSIGLFHTLLLSGGEPFSRSDLFELCEVFIKQNRISILAIPTNCIYPEKVIEFSKKILTTYPKLILSINSSLDGFEDTHDAIRGVSGIFDKVVTTLTALSELKSGYNNLEVAVNTVITKRNLGELTSLMDFVYSNFNVNYHDFELLRGDYKDKGLGLPSLEDIKKIHQRIAQNTERYLKKQQAGLIEQIAVLGLLLFTQKMKEACLAGKKPEFVCSAGANIGVIDVNADVKLCELLPAVGNLKNCNYDFPAVWNSAEAAHLKEKIKIENCQCTHICFLKLTASRYIRNLFSILYYYLAYKKIALKFCIAGEAIFLSLFINSSP